MQVINGTIDFQLKDKTAVAIGKFDGVHKGHELILNTLMSYKERGYKTCVMTFDFPPNLFFVDAPNRTLMTAQEKRYVMAEMGVDILIEYPFRENTASISAENFIEDVLLDQLKMGVVVAGTDCSFGHGAKGNAKMLKEFAKKHDFECIIIDKIKDEKGQVISSTLLRDIVIKGDVSDYMSKSRWPYFAHGNFKKSGGMGQKFGLPFCVLAVDENKLLPAEGIYYTKVLHDDVYYPAISFVSGKKQRIETYMFDSNRNIGKDNVSVGFYQFVRKAFEGDESAYISQEKRIEQFKGELINAQIWHREHPL